MEEKQVPVQASAASNVRFIRQLFDHNEYLVVRDISGTKNGRAILVYLNVLIDEKAMNEFVIRKISEDQSRLDRASSGTIRIRIYLRYQACSGLRAACRAVVFCAVDQKL